MLGLLLIGYKLVFCLCYTCIFFKVSIFFVYCAICEVVLDVYMDTTFYGVAFFIVIFVVDFVDV